MARRWGLGPVFEFESLITARRRQVYVARSLFVAILLASLGVVWWAKVADQSLATIRAQANVGQDFYVAIVGTQLVLVLLAAPAATAGTICLDKARGTLTHLLTTDLSSSEIVLGKLAARLVPVFTLVLCSQPVMALVTLLGGIDPAALTGALLVTLGVAVLGCSLALLLSVWGRKTHEVLMTTYAILVAWTLGGPTYWLLKMSGLAWVWLPDWFTESNPFWLAFGNTWTPGAVGLEDDVRFLAVALGLSAALAATAVARLRAVAANQAGQGARRRRLAGVLNLDLGRASALLPGPSLDHNPVLWREWHRRRPSRWGRILWAIYGLAALGITVLMIGSAFGNNRAQREVGAILCGGQVALGFLLLSVAAATSLAEERVRGSLDVLLATPMTTRSIVLGKWWGAYRGVLVMAVLPGLATAAYAAQAGRFLAVFLVVGLILAYGGALTSLGLGLATWIPRLGRAVALTVTADILMTVGWIFLIILLFPGGGNMSGPGMASASPFFGTLLPLIVMDQGGPRDDWPECVAWILFWIFFYGTASIVLLAAVLATFDRALGRVPEQHFLRRPRPEFPYPMCEASSKPWRDPSPVSSEAR